MKTKITIILLLCMLVVGCGEKKIENKSLTCEKNYTVLENEVKEKIVSKYIDEKLVSTDLEIKMFVAEKYLEYKDILEENLLGNYEEYQNKKGISFNLYNGDEILTLAININYQELDESSFNELGFSNDESTYNDALETLSSDGYICS